MTIFGYNIGNIWGVSFVLIIFSLVIIGLVIGSIYEIKLERKNKYKNYYITQKRGDK